MAGIAGDVEVATFRPRPSDPDDYLALTRDGEVRHAITPTGASNLLGLSQGYGKGHSEEIIGRALRERSDEVLVATKVPPAQGPWPPPRDADVDEFFPAGYVTDELEKSLRRLGSDHVDVYQFHTWSPRFNLTARWYIILYICCS